MELFLETNLEKCPEVSNFPIYAAGGYQQIIANYDLGKVNYLILERDKKRSIIPILTRRISEEHCEAYSAYGYGGIVGDIEIDVRDVSMMKEFLYDRKIISLFLRHSPFNGNARQFPKEYVELNRITYSTALRKESNFEERVRKLPQKIRWSVNKALQSGYRVRAHYSNTIEPNTIRTFYSIYLDLMQRIKASAYYKFSEEFFLQHLTRLNHNCDFLEVIDRHGEPVGGAIFLRDTKDWVHYHLSALNVEASKNQVMELLMIEAIEYYSTMKFKNLHLGGGHNLNESDGLSKFKIKFCSNKHEFYISKIVTDEPSYIEERNRLPLECPNLFSISEARGGNQFENRS